MNKCSINKYTQFNNISFVFIVILIICDKTINCTLYEHLESNQFSEITIIFSIKLRKIKKSLNENQKFCNDDFIKKYIYIIIQLFLISGKNVKTRL